MSVLTRKSEPSIGQLERRLVETREAVAVCRAELEQVEAAAAELLASAADYDLADWQRERAVLDRRLVDRRNELEHLEATEAAIVKRGIAAAHEESNRKEARLRRECEAIDEERRALFAQVAKLDAKDEKTRARLAIVERERLPLVARFDPEAAAAVKQRAHDERNLAVQLAHARIRGEDVFVPEELAALVREVEPGVRADLTERQQYQRAALLGRGIGYVKLDQFEQPIDGAPVRRRGFADEE